VRTFIVPAEPLTADEISRGHLFHLSITADDPPGLDDTAATETALGRLYADLDPEGVAEVPLSAAVEYRLALAACRAAESRKQRAVNTLRSLMGTAKTATADGVDVAERRVGKRAGYQVAPKVIDGLWPKTAGLEKLDG
jgi:hypothetical protein